MAGIRSNVNAMHKQNGDVIHIGNLLLYLCHANDLVVYQKYEIIA